MFKSIAGTACIYKLEIFFFRLPRPPQMAELLEMLMVTQDRLRPYLERYRALMATDPVLSPTVSIFK